MNYLGDFNTSSTVRGFFNTRKADGTPITLDGTPTIAVYKDGSTTESTSGVTLTVNFDSRTGMHLYAIDTSADGAFYSSGSDFRVVLSAGTVDGVSVVGAQVGAFSLANRSALRPAVAGRTVSVDATGGVFVVGDMLGNNLVIPALATQAADAVWDEAYNQHTTAGTFGKLMDLLRKSNLSIDGTVTSAITPTTLTFSSDVAATTSAYAHAVLLFTSGPLEGENSPIISYNSTNGVFVLEEPLTAAPTAGDKFVVIAGSHVHAIADIQAGLALQTTSLAIKTKTDLITAGKVQIVSPVGAGGNIITPIFIGDDYKASNNRAFKWTIDARTGFSVSTATCRFGGSSEETGDLWNVSGTVTDIGGGEWELSFDLTKTVTGALSPGFYRWSVELANPGGDEVTEVYNSNANRQAEVRAKQT